MTGEMNFIDQDGNDSNGDSWPLHAAIAKELGGVIKPFDVYQGPYVVFGEDVRIGCAPYAIAPSNMGVKRLWLLSDDGCVCQWYREDTDDLSWSFWWDDDCIAIEAARELLGG